LRRQKIEDVKEIHFGQPMALLASVKTFLKCYPEIKLVEAWIRAGNCDANSKNRHGQQLLAIARKAAAELYQFRKL